MIREPSKWYITFKARNKWTWSGNKYFVITATSEDQARKKTIDLFKKDWENVYSEEEWNNDNVMKRIDKLEYIELDEREYRKNIEKANRIRYQTFRERE